MTCFVECPCCCKKYAAIHNSTVYCGCGAIFNMREYADVWTCVVLKNNRPWKNVETP